MIVCLVCYYASGIYSYFMPLPKMISFFACSLYVNIAFNAKLYTVIPEQMPYS